MSDTVERPRYEPALRTLAMPKDTNIAGDIFGGWVLAQMDIAAGITAGQRARGRVVTAAVDGMSFHRPIYVGDIVSIYADVVGVGRSSMKIKVSTWVQRRHADTTELDEFEVTEAVFTLVAVDQEGKARPIDQPG